ncbi:hypothetical protein D3C72_1499900 [compost metagenome]
MGIRSASSKAADSGAARHLSSVNERALPFLELFLDNKWGPAKVNFRIQYLCMQGRRELPMLELEQHFGQGRDSRRAFTMPNIGFNRTDRAKLPIRCFRLECPRQPGDFDRISQRSTGAVSFQIAD